MYDMLHTLSQFKDCANKLETVYLVETSAAMRGMQERKLSEVGKQKGLREDFTVKWCDSVEEVPAQAEEMEEMFTMVTAHEFFDALPVHLLEVSRDHSVISVLHF